MTSFLDRLLGYYNLSQEDYQRLIEAPSLAKLPLIKEDKNVQKAIVRLAEAKEKREPVLIYGDYDVDGITSASILFRSFHDFGLNVAAYLPSRYLDGYGITAKNIERIAARGYKLIVTCDNGVTAHEALLKAKEKGLSTIVLDHHEFDETEPECDILVHGRPFERYLQRQRLRLHAPWQGRRFASRRDPARFCLQDSHEGRR